MANTDAALTGTRYQHLDKNESSRSRGRRQGTSINKGKAVDPNFTAPPQHGSLTTVRRGYTRQRGVESAPECECIKRDCVDNVVLPPPKRLFISGMGMQQIQSTLAGVLEGCMANLCRGSQSVKE
ncbi:hypothetical protein ACOME3_010516 [Neoechinorhynchus agilis]